jgi:hypothetical protein
MIWPPPNDRSSAVPSFQGQQGVGHVEERCSTAGIGAWAEGRFLISDKEDDLYHVVRQVVRWRFAGECRGEGGTLAVVWDANEAGSKKQIADPVLLFRSRKPGRRTGRSGCGTLRDVVYSRWWMS